MKLQIAHEGNWYAIPGPPVWDTVGGEQFPSEGGYSLSLPTIASPNVKTGQGSQRVYREADIAVDSKKVAQITFVAGHEKVLVNGLRVVRHNCAAMIMPANGSGPIPARVMTETSEAPILDGEGRLALADLHNAELELKKSETELKEKIQWLNHRMRAMNARIAGNAMMSVAMNIPINMLEDRLLGVPGKLADKLAKGSGYLVEQFVGLAEFAGNLVLSDNAAETNQEGAQYAMSNVLTHTGNIAQAQGAERLGTAVEFAGMGLDTAFDVHGAMMTPVFAPISSDYLTTAADTIRRHQNAANGYWYGDEASLNRLGAELSPEQLETYRKVFEDSKESSKLFGAGRTPFDVAANAVQAWKAAKAKLEKLKNSGVLIRASGSQWQPSSSRHAARTISVADFEACMKSPDIPCRFEEIPTLSTVTVRPPKTK